MRYILSFILLTATSALANVPIAWDDPSNDPTTIYGYGVYVNGNRNTVITAGTTADITLQAGSYTAHVTAISNEGLESLPSNSISFSVMHEPANLRINADGSIFILP